MDIQLDKSKFSKSVSEKLRRVFLIAMLLGGGAVPLAQQLKADDLRGANRVDSSVDSADSRTDSRESSGESARDSAESNADSSDSAQNSEAVYIGESVISASGYEQDIKDAPASISIIPKEEIMTRPIRDLGDAVQDTPGVYVEANKTGGNTISMRGFGSAYTLILIDGKRQNVAQGYHANGFDGTNSSFMPPLSMIERIEVIRGPASTIYGSDAMGGVINIITKKNPDRVSGGFQLEMKLAEHSDVFGNIYGANAYVASPIVDKVLSFNLRGGYKYGGQNAFYKPGYGKNSTITANGNGYNNPYLGWSATGFQSWNVGGRLNWTINENNNIYVDLENYFTRAGSLNTSSNSVTVVRDFYKINSILNYDADYEWGKLNAYAQYSHNMWAAHYDKDRRAKNQIGLFPGSTHGDGIAWDSATHNQDAIFQTTYTNNFDLDSAGVIIFNGGVYYMYEHLFVKKGNNNHLNQFALFAEGEYLINEYISTTLGLRLNVSDKFNSIAVPNPRFYVNANPTQWLTIKAGVSSGVLVPRLSYLYDGYTISTSGGNQVATYGNTNLKPEQSWNYELSLISDSRWVNLTLTGFYTDFRNKISSISNISQGTSLDGQQCTGAQSCTFYRNLDRALITGAEFGFRLKPIYGFSLDASYGFTYTKTLKTKAGQEYLKGEPVNSIPMHKFAIKPTYQYEGFEAYIRYTGNFMTPTAAVSATSLNTSARGLVGKYYKDYQLVDIAVSYKFPKYYSITFAVNNLLDTKFEEDLVSYNRNGSTSYMNRYQRILPSRSYWLTFKADF